MRVTSETIMCNLSWYSTSVAQTLLCVLLVPYHGAQTDPELFLPIDHPLLLWDSLLFYQWKNREIWSATPSENGYLKFSAQADFLSNQLLRVVMTYRVMTIQLLSGTCSTRNNLLSMARTWPFAWDEVIWSVDLVPHLFYYHMASGV